MFVDIPPAEQPLPDKEWHKHLEAILNCGQVNPDILCYMDYKQQYCINEIKKTFKRINYRNARQTSEDTEGTESTKESI